MSEAGKPTVSYYWKYKYKKKDGTIETDTSDTKPKPDGWWGQYVVGEPQEVKEEIHPDGEVIISFRDEKGNWVEGSRDLNKGRQDLSNSRMEEARKVAALAPKQKSPAEQEKDSAEARKSTAEADALEAKNKASATPQGQAVAEAERQRILAESQAAVARANPPKIATGRTVQIPEGPAQPEYITKEQADYNRVTAADANTIAQQGITNKRNDALDTRQGLVDAAHAANEALRISIAQAANGIAQGQLSRQQANDKIQEDLQRIQLDLNKQQLEITKRGQDMTKEVSIRGQDLNAGVSQRGQDMSYATALAQSGVSIANNNTNNWAVNQSQVDTRNSLFPNAPPVTRSPAPYGPDLPLQLAQQAQQQAPRPYQLPGGPQEQQAYRLPG